MIGLKCQSRSCSANVDYIATSPKQDQRADVNSMAVLAMRSIGKGRAAATRFSAFVVKLIWGCSNTGGLT
jgi:hypothetical protein